MRESTLKMVLDAPEVVEAGFFRRHHLVLLMKDLSLALAILKRAGHLHLVEDSAVRG
jgi:hypothetical protein